MLIDEHCEEDVWKSRIRIIIYYFNAILKFRSVLIRKIKW